ncbi:MAG: hypothetical protein M1569_03570 [Candidatus Marsarchaeota archaeon]|nr:hypothetical protein [Candidatus Marsarchaeota archaeon]MCL5413454.1 hypothetical protein [Candidatus Marsarchaeota archaeon]
MPRDEDEETAIKPQSNGRVSIIGPMILWTILLLVAISINITIANFNAMPATSTIYAVASAYSKFVLSMPGITILPLIIGAIIGAEIGSRSRSLKRTAKIGFLNGIYLSVIYAITIIVLYIVLDYGTSQALALSAILLNSIILPIIVLLISIEIFAILSFSRKVDL